MLLTIVEYASIDNQGKQIVHTNQKPTLLVERKKNQDITPYKNLITICKHGFMWLFQ